MMGICLYTNSLILTFKNIPTAQLSMEFTTLALWRNEINNCIGCDLYSIKDILQQAPRLKSFKDLKQYYRELIKDYLEKSYNLIKITDKCETNILSIVDQINILEKLGVSAIRSIEYFGITSEKTLSIRLDINDTK